MVFFKDFGKTVSDLFKADKYELNRTMQVTAKSGNSEWVTKTVITEKGAMKNKLTYTQRDKTFGAAEVVVPTKGSLEIKYTTPKLADGLKTDLVLKQPCLDLKNKYTRGSIKSQSTTTFNTDRNSPSVDCLYGDASVTMEGFSVGGSVKIKPGADQALADYNVGLQYSPSDKCTLALTTANRMDHISSSIWYKYSDCGELGARYNLNIEKMGNPQVEVGGRWKVDDKGTLQGVVRAGGGAMCLYKHKLSKSMTASLGASIGQAMTADSTKVHYKLEFTA